MFRREEKALVVTEAWVGDVELWGKWWESSFLGGGREGNYLQLFSLYYVIKIVAILWGETRLMFLFLSPLFPFISQQYTDMPINF